MSRSTHWMLFGLLLSGCSSAAAKSSRAVGSVEVVKGCFHTIWGSPPHYFVAVGSSSTELIVADSILSNAGGVLALNGSTVTVAGTRTADRALQTSSLRADSARGRTCN